MRIVILSLFSVFSSSLPVHTEGEQKSPATLDRNHFRIKLERIGEAADGFEVWRLQLWTADQRYVAVLSADANVTDLGLTKPQPETKLHHVDIRFVISSTGLAQEPNGPPQRDVETWIRIAGNKVASSRSTEKVAAAVRWKDIVQLSPISRVYGSNRKVLLGKINHRRLEIEVRLSD